METPEAVAFWSSRHKLNRIKAIMAFSLDLDNANDNLRRAGYYRQYRKRYLQIYSTIIADPAMKNVPFSQLDEFWWDPKPLTTTPVVPVPPPTPGPLTILSTDPGNLKIGQDFTLEWSGGVAPFKVQFGGVVSERRTINNAQSPQIINLSPETGTLVPANNYHLKVTDSTGAVKSVTIALSN